MRRDETLPPFHPTRPHLTRPVRIDPTGATGPTPEASRGRRWRRTSRGWFLPSALVHAGVEQRIVEASMRLPSFGGVTGWATLRWAGGTWFDGLAPDGRTTLPVCLAVATSAVRGVAGVATTREGLGPRELEVVDGLRTTTVRRALAFEMRYADSVREAVVALDMAAASDLMDLHETGCYLATLNAHTGIPQARAAWLLGEENSWSPWETRLRLVWQLDAGLPRPLCNAPIFDQTGRHIGTPDLFDPVAGVVGEYDGGLHLAGRQRAKDVAREGRFRSVGLEYFSVLSSDMGHAEVVVDRIVSTRGRARWLAPSRRAWTLTPPPGWKSTSTVTERRARRAETRQSG